MYRNIFLSLNFQHFFSCEVSAKFLFVLYETVVNDFVLNIEITALAGYMNIPEKHLQALA